MKLLGTLCLIGGFCCLARAGDTNAANLVAAPAVASTNAALEISQHRQNFLALQREYFSSYSATSTNALQRAVLLQALKREESALVRSGYLVEVGIPVNGVWNATKLTKAMRGASFKDKELISCTLPPYERNGVRLLLVRARPDDMLVWLERIAYYDLQ